MTILPQRGHFYLIFLFSVSWTKVLEAVVDIVGADLSFVFKS